jgi:N6-adenosine-specific RNA methylase IME4
VSKFQIIYSDAPWAYRDAGCNGAAAKQYPTMSVAQLKALPVADIAAADSVLFLWATWPLLPEALEVIKSWSFRFVSCAFLWVKANKRAETDQYRFLPEDAIDTFYGLGRWCRGNSEPCLLAVKGKPKRVSNAVQQIIYAPIGKHSEKPPETRTRIVQLMGDLPRVELFARQKVEGWVSLGFGINGKDIKEELEALAK